MLFLVILLVLAIGVRWACGRICPLGILEDWFFRNFPAVTGDQTALLRTYLYALSLSIFKIG